MIYGSGPDSDFTQICVAVKIILHTYRKVHDLPELLYNKSGY